MKAVLGSFAFVVSIFATDTPVATPAAFPSPDAAVNALAEAVEAQSEPLLVWVLGSEVVDALNAGSSNRDADWFRNVSLFGSVRPDRLRRLVRSDNRIELLVGAGDPFALPIVRTKSGWCFDGKAGALEVAKRRIRRNESAAIDLCYRYRDAQLDFVRRGYPGVPPGFAQRINSSPGEHDGLYWSGVGLAEESPLGPVVARAAYAESGPGVDPVPYAGYYVKVLLGQGPDATGGALDYRVDGRLVRGFALVAWPADYGRSGLHTFLVNQDGELLQKDLGPNSGLIAAGMTAFNPDCTWSRGEPPVD
jgi:hypothetical protein